MKGPGVCSKRDKPNKSVGEKKTCVGRRGFGKTAAAAASEEKDRKC